MKITKVTLAGAAFALAPLSAVSADHHGETKMADEAEAPAKSAAEEAAGAVEAPVEAPVAAAPMAEEAVSAEVASPEPAAPAVKADHTPEGSEIFVPAPPEGKGQIVFFRPGGMGMAMGCTVNQGSTDDRTKITSLGNGKYSIVVAESGKQDYWVKNEKKDGMTLLVEEGETQFVRCRIKMGFMSGRPDISPSSPEEFTRKSGGMKLVDDDDMGVGALSAAEIEAAK